jgi:hypothetical protein
MVATIAQIIGKINPKQYADNGGELLAKYRHPDRIPAEEVEPKPAAEHTLGYESSSETLEPVYFFILDMMNDFGLAPEKLADNFTSSPGSGHFAELGQRATIMQQQGTKILVDVNTVLRSVLNIIYDLKELRLRLQHYDDLKTENKEGALLSLKQIWLDKVDFITKGTTSIKQLVGQVGFQTLLDAFLAVKDLKDVDKIDLNDRIKRILRPRILEFNTWVEHSEKELRKRYEIERTYLGSQVNSLKLYSRWAKPYLRVAHELEMREGGREPALVKAFNTILLELTLLGKQKLKVKEVAIQGDLPKAFEKLQTKRDCYSCVLVDFRFRGIPQRVSQQAHYVFGGKVEVSYKAYVLNGDELKKLNEELDESDLGDVLGLIEGATTQSLEQLQEEINFFLEDKSVDDKGKPKRPQDTSNPFVALFGGYSDEKRETPKEGGKKEWWPKPESFIEKQNLRPVAESAARTTAFKLFDLYKKAHGMPSFT